jgi:hypothetical protein
VKLHLSWTLMAFVSAVTLGHELAKTHQPLDGDGHDLRVLTASQTDDSKNHAQAHKNHGLSQLVEDVESGMRSPDWIQKRLESLSGQEAIVGQESAVDWANLEELGPLQLTRVVHHVQNLDSGFEILSTHILPSLGQAENSTTHFTQRILEADEQSESQVAIVLSRLLEIRNGQPLLEERSLARYMFSFKTDRLRDRFTLRTPEGHLSVDAELKSALHPLALLTQETGTFTEVEDNLFEVPHAGLVYSVMLTPRVHALNSELNLEIQIRELNSTITNTFVLTYHPLKK